MDEAIERNNDDEWCTQQYQAVRKQLAMMEVMLNDCGDENAPFLGGTTPIHADFCVYA